MKYICTTPKENLNVGLSTFTEDCYGYYGQIAIIDETDGEELTDWVDDHCVYPEELEGLSGDERYTKAHDLMTEYMLSVKEALIERYYNNQMDIIGQ